ncbi:unnamed protein product [Spirodela intermedia]|uniref:Amino acid transporter transmembrane domain-containing protein n=1 Tax=Spirodela intermedia TaxID=51605 RepID=A0A7I8J515_SPIIN|nr:unnamed protein product [Spirodela intermedia]CAA6665191.1 unnamed protein product [Spirodela intermedia]
MAAFSASSSPGTSNAIPPRHHGAGSGVEATLLGDYEKGTERALLIKNIPYGGASFARTCFNGLNALSGVGVLSIPYALSEGGWLSVAWLIVIAAACCYTGLLLQRCMNSGPYLQSYPDIGESAFCLSGRITISVVIYLELYLVSTGFLILEGNNLDKLFPTPLFTLLAALVILPTTWLRSLGALAYFSLEGVGLGYSGRLCPLGRAFDQIGFHERGKLINFGGLPTSLGLYAFCYCGHAVFPALCTSMRDRTQFPKALSVCFLLCTLNYTFMAVIGYLMYGEGIKSQVNSTFQSKISSPKSQFIPHCSMFGYLMALIGSFLSVAASLLLPCVCYLKIFGLGDQSRLQLAVIMGILVMGVLVGVTGTTLPCARSPLIFEASFSCWTNCAGRSPGFILILFL